MNIVDLVGKLGPVAVAIAVYLLTRQTSAWTRAVSTRSAEVEDQKLKLALLDRRLVAIDAFREAAQEFMTHGAATADVVKRTYEALKIAEVVFDDDEEQAISDLLQKLLRWQAADRSRERWRDHDETKLQAAVDNMMQIETELIDDLGALRKALLAATKVRAVPPVTKPSSLIEKLRGKLRKS